MNNFNKLTLIAFSILSLSTACEKAEMPIPAEKTPTSPATPPATPPSVPQSPIPTPPIEQVPPAPSIPGLLRKIKWAPLDFKEFQYNPQGGLSKYIRQYNNVQGTDHVQRDEYEFIYDEKGKLLRMNDKNGTYTRYSYAGDVWSEAITYDKLERPLRKYLFTFSANKQLLEFEELNLSVDGRSTPRAKTSFIYNSAGNLTTYKYWWYVESSQSFTLSTELRFSNFDQKNYPKNADSFNHVLQPLSFFVNNPGKKELISSYAPIEHYSYTYDTHGYPNSKRVTYSYDKPLPSMQMEFEY